MINLFFLCLFFVFGCDSTQIEDLLEEDHDSDVDKVSEIKMNKKGISGIARGNGRIFIVSDREGLFELNEDFTVKSLVFSDRELEGVTVDEKTGNVWVCRERKQLVTQINPDTKEVVSSFSLSNHVSSKNRGLEGIVFDHLTRTLFLVREKHKPAVLQVSTEGDLLNEIIVDVDDLSDITIYRGSFYLLSQEGQSVNIVDGKFNPFKRWHLPLKKAEGFLFLDDGTFLVSDDEDKSIFQFKFED